jgi:Secretion system C-terminal sorting domain
MRVLFSILICCIALLTNAQKQNIDDQIALQDINNLDSIIVDFANGTLTGNILAVPLYIITDDDINALDFSFKMNETKVKVDTIIKNGTFEMTYFFNLNDRKLRLTSYSVSDYNTNKKILTIYFKLLQNTLDNKDLFEIAGFLNGDACPIKFTAKTFMVTSVSDEKYENKIAIYPNPTSDLLNITNGKNMLLKIANNTGAILHQEQIIAYEHSVKLSAFTPGVYYAIFESADGKQFSKSFIKN